MAESFFEKRASSRKNSRSSSSSSRTRRKAEEAGVMNIRLSGKVALELVKVEAGSFTMGSPEDEEGRSRCDET